MDQLGQRGLGGRSTNIHILMMKVTTTLLLTIIVVNALVLVDGATPVPLNSTNFDDFVSSNSNKVVLIEFHDRWYFNSGLFRGFNNLIELLDEDLMVFGRVCCDCDGNEELCNRYKSSNDTYMPLFQTFNVNQKDQPVPVTINIMEFLTTFLKNQYSQIKNQCYDCIL
ncbi:hypothetical protein PPL_05174 [Heterostelium album PN500]|uniref:Uncharacterized protein n=1 Tax=Heterostelium pallidum (strain ATCC 26659 / Pp 5 / PN500) TaxID=670386 RepID=D3B9M9_HETP5|nr:hypothetical protein PPL_05174 [Heterostelium album PN500]EFA81941.1 hypothetical protein PPL_05174 [Heterostelium album PN500]|eukprot:XP_020434058.1 hypothetical protein PPL_05174 [Heterostelium album PN500]